MPISFEIFTVDQSDLEFPGTIPLLTEVFLGKIPLVKYATQTQA